MDFFETKDPLCVGIARILSLSSNGMEMRQQQQHQLALQKETEKRPKNLIRTQAWDIVRFYLCVDTFSR